VLLKLATRSRSANNKVIIEGLKKGFDHHHSGETPTLEQPEWWGISVGRLCFAVKAIDAVSARELVARQLGIDSWEMIEVPTITRHHGPGYQEVFDERYPEHEVVRLIPWSRVEYPKDLDNLTDEQREALANADRITDA